MGVPIGELQDRVSSEEFALYAASLSIDPAAPERLEYHAQLIEALVCRLESALGGKPPAIEAPDYGDAESLRKSLSESLSGETERDSSNAATSERTLLSYFSTLKP
jgi:hypothetical protein